jgi:hypothetical protein
MTGHRSLTHEQARQLTLDSEPWLSCDDCFELMDRYVEEILRDPETTALPAMRVHLAACSACAEEAESLRDLVAGEDDAHPTAPLKG